MSLDGVLKGNHAHAHVHFFLLSFPEGIWVEEGRLKKKYIYIYIINITL